MNRKIEMRKLVQLIIFWKKKAFLEYEITTELLSTTQFGKRELRLLN